MTRAPAAALLVFLLAGAPACVDFLDPGDIGTPRYVDNMRGEAPLRLAPPITDRSGNTYVLYGAPDFTQTHAYTGLAAGGWKKGCNGHRGDGHGLHGWVGRGQDRAWYWSGEALVEVAPEGGPACDVLGRDPQSRAAYRYLAVLPLVKETPSKTSAVALIAAEGDPRPHWLVVDLLRKTGVARPFEPDGAEDIQVIGVGASANPIVGFAVVRYRLAGHIRVEALYVSHRGELLKRVPLSGLDDAPPYAVRGYLQSADGRRVAGLLAGGDLLSFSPDGGGRVALGLPFEPAGVHRWRKHLFVVGSASRRPVVAPIDASGAVGEAQPWFASLAAEDALRDHRVRILDDRNAPMTRAVWASPQSAVGTSPFLSPFAPEEYALGTTSWLIAGPSYRSGGDVMTAVAMLPIGISYP